MKQVVHAHIAEEEGVNNKDAARAYSGSIFIIFCKNAAKK